MAAVLAFGLAGCDERPPLAGQPAGDERSLRADQPAGDGPGRPVEVGGQPPSDQPDGPGEPDGSVNAGDGCAPKIVRPSRAPGPSVGVNYNGMSRNVDVAPGGELERVGAEWARAFVDMQQLLDKNAAEIAADEDIAGVRRLHGSGYRTIVSLKWPFLDRDFPRPGTVRMKKYVDVMHRVLDGTGPGVDVVVAGNEPFRETRPEYRDQDLVRFYEVMTSEIEAYRQARCRSFEIFMGSFNNVHAPEERTAPLNALIDFADRTEWIAGIDLHEHHLDRKDLPEALAWARTRISAGKQIIVTEFSLAQRWRAENTKPIPAAFAKRHGYPADLRAYQYLHQVNVKPVPQAEWIDYMSSTGWISGRKDYIVNSYAEFKKYDVSVATYGMRQGRRVNDTATSLPWSYNGIFCNFTCQPGADGKSSFNYAWIDNFRRIREGDVG
uniref:hypothetical protein n=1 Tax=Paractinoplanes polyasparticus TaxID=2856853 RepID=UPI001C84E340|nr:hypothetical protein [Actinoplanes polyasparticus]